MKTETEMTFTKKFNTIKEGKIKKRAMLKIKLCIYIQLKLHQLAKQINQITV